MAQVTDYTVSNQTFPNTRADLNNIFAAIATNNSGTTAPSNQQAGQWWIDTTSSTWILYIHDGSDDIQFATIDTSANTVNFTDSALDVVTDLTPQLGGDLDLNSNDITGTGNINITGTATVSGDLTVDTNTLYVNSSNNRVGIGTSSPSTPLTLDIGTNNVGLFQNSTDATSGFSLADNGGSINLATTSSGAFRVLVGGDANTSADNSSEAMRIDSSGNVGIGVVPQTWYTQLDTLQIGLAGSLAGNTTNPSRTYLSANAYLNASNQETYIATDEASQYFQNAGTHIFKVAPSGTAGTAISFTEAMKIDNSGNVLVGKTSDSFADVGVVLSDSQANSFTRDGANVMSVRRNTSDGDLVSYYKDATKVGSIGTRSNNLSIGSSDTGLEFNHSNDVIFPANPSTNNNRDNAISLGSSEVRFTNLYLSNSVYLGGTGSANALDDYEEGTWTPVLGGVSGESGQTYSTQLGFYTKIGRQLFFIAEIQLSNKGTITGNIIIDGLPFTVQSTNSGASFSKLSWFSSVNNQIVGFPVYGTGYIRLRDAGLNGDNINLTTSNITNDTGIIVFGTYIA